MEGTGEQGRHHDRIGAVGVLPRTALFCHTLTSECLQHLEIPPSHSVPISPKSEHWMLEQGQYRWPVSQWAGSFPLRPSSASTLGISMSTKANTERASSKGRQCSPHAWPVSAYCFRGPPTRSHHTICCCAQAGRRPVWQLFTHCSLQRSWAGADPEDMLLAAACVSGLLAHTGKYLFVCFLPFIQLTT